MCYNILSRLRCRNNWGPLMTVVKEKTEAAVPTAVSEEEREAKQKLMAARLLIVKGASGRDVPFGGALIRISGELYEPSRLTISSFSIKPYDGQLVPGQMFQCDILLPSETEPYVISVGGAVKTIDNDFGLRAIFASPQPHVQINFANHLILARKHDDAAAIAAAAKTTTKKKGFW